MASLKLTCLVSGDKHFGWPSSYYSWAWEMLLMIGWLTKSSYLGRDLSLLLAYNVLNKQGIFVISIVIFFGIHLQSIIMSSPQSIMKALYCSLFKASPVWGSQFGSFQFLFCCLYGLKNWTCPHPLPSQKRKKSC